MGFTNGAASRRPFASEPPGNILFSGASLAATTRFLGSAAHFLVNITYGISPPAS